MSRDAGLALAVGVAALRIAATPGARRSSAGETARSLTSLGALVAAGPSISDQAERQRRAGYRIDPAVFKI